MRKSLLVGVVLASAAGLMVLLGSALDLELESVALLGGALGAVVALVPDRTALTRLGGFAAGFVAAWIGYVVRAAVLPDTSSGRAVAVVVTVLLCTAVALATRERLPLWTLLLGTAALTGAYEFIYAAAPPELMTTSVSTATTLFLSVSLGFAAGLLGTPSTSSVETPDPWLEIDAADELDSTTAVSDMRLDNLMEKTK
jgi:hypothetical protein